jgi:hypothetical protein
MNCASRRVFYRVVANEVLVVMIGRKRGNVLVVDRGHALMKFGLL